MGIATWNSRTLLAAVGGSAIALGALIAAVEAVTRPTVAAATLDIDPEALATQLEGWAADLRSQKGVRS